MRSKTLTVNYNHMRSQIKAEYLRYLDVFHKSFLATLIHLNTPDTPLVPTTVMENAQYTKQLSDMYLAHTNGRNILTMFDGPEVHVFVDIQIYLQEFLMDVHNFKEYNYYNITVDPKYNIIIANKQLGQYVI